MFRLLFGILISVVFLSCGDKTVPLFTIDFQEQFSIPAGLNTIETHTFVIQDIPSLLESYKANFNVLDEDIASILPSRGRINQIFSNIDFDFIQSVSIWMVSNVDPQYRYELYYLDFVPVNTGDEIRLLSGISNLKDLMNEGSFDLEIKLKFRTFPPNQTDNVLNFGLVANAN
jgi:hypothetical protein